MMNASINALLEAQREFQGVADELVYAPRKIQPGLFQIRDINDYPVLYTALAENVDILITGDKDFSEIEMEKPEVLTPTEFLEKYA